MMLIPLGKLPSDLLVRLLAHNPATDRRVLLGPGLGFDCAVIDLENGRCLVAKTDPITFATEAIGWYAVHVNANDIATTGATPRWFLATILLPESKSDASLVEDIFTQVQSACAELGASVVGGHTEVTFGIDRPIVVGSMLGEVARDQLITPRGARVGDAVVLTKRIAVEATSILAREKASELVSRLGVPFLQHARRFLTDPGISVVRDAQVALAAGRVHAMHDPTEGGLATGLYELAAAAQVGLEVVEERVPVYPETRTLCAVYNINVWGAIASGSLLLAVDPVDAEKIVAALRAAGIEAWLIGRIVEPERGVTLIGAEGTRPLPAFARDEITKAFG